MPTEQILEDELTPDRLDKFNYRSDARQLGRQYYDNDLESNREIHSFIAHYASLLANDFEQIDGKITTTLHNEKVIITSPKYRNPLREFTYLITLREDLHYAPDGKREYVSEFRDTLARYICEVAKEALTLKFSKEMGDLVTQQSPIPN